MTIAAFAMRLSDEAERELAKKFHAMSPSSMYTAKSSTSAFGKIDVKSSQYTSSRNSGLSIDQSMPSVELLYRERTSRHVRIARSSR